MSLTTPVSIQFYVAARLSDAEAASRVASALTACSASGFKLECVYPWFEKGQVDHHDEKALRQRAEEEQNAIREADFVVGLYPGGAGTHFELGLAYGLGKPILLLDLGTQTDLPQYPCVFHQLLPRLRVDEQGVGPEILSRIFPHPGTLYAYRGDRDRTYTASRIFRAQTSGAPLHRLGDNALMISYVGVSEEADGEWIRPLGEFLLRFTPV